MVGHQGMMKMWKMITEKEGERRKNRRKLEITGEMNSRMMTMEVQGGKMKGKRGDTEIEEEEEMKMIEDNLKNRNMKIEEGEMTDKIEDIIIEGGEMNRLRKKSMSADKTNATTEINKEIQERTIDNLIMMKAEKERMSM